MSPQKAGKQLESRGRDEHLEVLAQDGQGGVLPGRVVLRHVDGTVRRLLGRLFSSFLRK